jgi:hypothetical protein
MLNKFVKGYKPEFMQFDAWASNLTEEVVKGGRFAKIIFIYWSERPPLHYTGNIFTVFQILFYWHNLVSTKEDLLWSYLNAN